MLKKIMPLIVMGLGAHEYDKKGKKMKGDLNKDGKMSGYEKARSKAIEKAVMKKKYSKSKCKSCGGKGCSKCKE